MSEPYLWSLVIAASLSVALSFLLTECQSIIERFIRPRDDRRAVQNSHVGEPLRLGGVAVLCGLCLGAAALSDQTAGQHSLWLIASGLPVFLAGVSEDLGYLVSPFRRFLAAIVSAVIATAALGLWAPRADLPFLDDALAIATFGIPITVLFAAGFCHALNLIDGMNGLAALTIGAAAVGLSYIAHRVGLDQMAVLSGLLAAGTLGFFFFNWPVGRLFLGDAGAYTLGHFLVWIAISIAALAPGVAVPALLLVLFWPLADVAHTITRRALDGLPIHHPDRMHLHQKIRRGLEIVVLGRGRKALSNPLTTLVMAPMVITPVVAGVLLYDQSMMAWVAFLGFLGLFAVTNLAIIQFARTRRKSNGEGTSDTGGRGLATRKGASGIVSLPPAKIESKFSGVFIEDGLSVDVRIYRYAHEDFWRMETDDGDHLTVTWSQRFATDQEAWRTFLETVRAESMEAVSGDYLATTR